MNPFADYRLTSPYGWRIHPITGKKTFHTGVDLVKHHRAPINAFVGGEVIHAKDGAAGSGLGGYGITVCVKCPDSGHLHVYAHLDSVAVKVGEHVKQGQVLGYQGNTGQSTGSHLHYEIRKTSSPSYGWIADRENNCFEPTEYLINYYKNQREKLMMKPEDANKIIKFLQAAYMIVADYPEARKEFNYLANELRRVSGQEQE